MTLPSSGAAVASANPGQCLEAGPFDIAATQAAERTLRDAGLPDGSWVARSSGGAFVVYMGRYPDAETLQRKLDELKRLKIDAQALDSPAAYQPGINLGRYDRQSQADGALASLAQRGVRTALVITVRAPPRQTMLRVAAADAAVRAQLAGLRLPTGPGFVACAGR